MLSAPRMGTCHLSSLIFEINDHVERKKVLSKFTNRYSVCEQLTVSCDALAYLMDTGLACSSQGKPSTLIYCIGGLLVTIPEVGLNTRPTSRNRSIRRLCSPSMLACVNCRLPLDLVLARTKPRANKPYAPARWTTRAHTVHVPSIYLCMMS